MLFTSIEKDVSVASKKAALVRICLFFFPLLIISFFSPKSFSSPNFDGRPEINSYNKNLYDESSATVLRREVEVSVDEAGLSNSRTYMAILLNDEAAIQDYSQIEINHNTYSSDLTINFARVHNGDDVNYLREDAITRQNLSSENFLYDNERTLFSLPSLRKGSVIEFEYTQKSKQIYVPGHFDSLLGFYWWEGRAGNADARLDPVNESIVKFTYPKSMEMNYRQSSLIQENPKKSVSDLRVTLEWASKDLPELKAEGWMPEDINLFPVVYVSSFSGWKDLNHWANSLFEPHISETNKIKKVAKEIEINHTTEEEKIRAVYDYMEENIRYVYAHVGRNGYEPHDALEVLSNGYGDCKDQAVLTVSILKALGIQAYPALVASRGGDMTQGMPRNYFDHMFVYIPESKNRAEMWFDTTGSKLDFPGVHWSHEGKSALVVNGTENKIKTVISDSQVQHLTSVDISFSSKKGVDIDISLNITYSGLMGQNVANMLNFSSDKDALIKEMLSPVYPKAKLIATSYEKIIGKKDTYTISAEFVAKDAWKGSPQPLNITSGVSQFVGLVSNFASLDEPSKRTKPFQTSLPLVMELSMTIPHPGGNYAPITINTSPDYESEYFNVEQSGHVNENGDYKIEAKLVFNELIVPVKDYENYYRASKDLIELPLWFISYQIDEKALELSKIASSKDSTDLDEIMSNAEIYLSNGEFEGALMLADKAVQLDADNAKAHYLRGVALGYKQQFEESNLAFAKALELGYEL